MTKLKPSMRLKVKRDTIFLPDENGSVYFRNNVGTFRMNGNMIDRWIEQLIPMFNGEHTLEYLTDDLPEEYCNQIYEIAESLYENGFAQDVSTEIPHQLPEAIREKYASQIEFLGHLRGSGGYWFQTYRQTKPLAIGSGPFFVSLLAALLESGLPQISYIVTDAMPTNRQRIEELFTHAVRTDPEVKLIELPKASQEAWREVVAPFSSILYVSQEGDVEELRKIHAACKEVGVIFVQALFTQQIGMAGPLVTPKSDGCWESAWRRLHQTALAKDPELHSYSSTAGALLANVIVFENFNFVTGVTDTQDLGKLYLLNLETLEGGWQDFLPHPAVNQSLSMEVVQDPELLAEQTATEKKRRSFVSWLSTLTSEETGILHDWDEGELIQLPLAQCRVQAVDPLADGPAKLMPAIVCSGFTHDEARKESGLAGIEMYVSRIVEQLVGTNGKSLGVMEGETIGVGAGNSTEEALCRALQSVLTTTFCKQSSDEQPALSLVQLTEVADDRCRFYLQAFAEQGMNPLIAVGQKIEGFPVLWVGLNESWHGGVGLTATLALRNALQHALMKWQNQKEYATPHGMEVRSAVLDEKEGQLEIVACGDSMDKELWLHALDVLKQNNKQLLILNGAAEPFLTKQLGGVFAVLLREGEYQ